MLYSKTWYFFVFVLSLVLGFFLITPVVNASTCHEITGKQICLLRLKRSAKYYWEYRATLSINGRKQPERIYNCRDRYYTASDSLKIYFLPDAPVSKSVCRLYTKV